MQRGLALVAWLFLLSSGAQAATYEVLARFGDPSSPSFAPGGALPYGKLVADGSGILYGTSFQSPELWAVNTYGVGFLSSGAVDLGSLGSQVYAGLIDGGSGKLYGVSTVGGTTSSPQFTTNIFSLAPMGGVYNEPSLVGSLSGFSVGGLLAGRNGTLYGTTATGGFGGGGVFAITPSASQLLPTTLTFFSGSAGFDPQSVLIQDRDGNLIGTNSKGGPGGSGTVFLLRVAASGFSSTPEVLASFAGTNGASPVGGLVADAAGNLFGTTSAGGANDKGTLFEIARTGTGYAAPVTLFDFNSTHGATPYGDLLIDADSNLYGTTYAGGLNDRGTIFRLARGPTGYASTPDVLHDFARTSGANPYAGLIADGSGNLFGTALIGGNPNPSASVVGAGVVYRLADSGFALTPTDVPIPEPGSLNLLMAGAALETLRRLWNRRPRAGST